MTKVEGEKESTLYGDIKVLEIYDELESRNYVDEIFKEILHNIKVTPAYVRLKEIALLHFTSIMSGENESLPYTEIMAKKKTQTAQIGFLSDAVGSTITKIVIEKLNSYESDIHSMIVKIIDDIIIEVKKSVEHEQYNNFLTPKSETSESRKSKLLNYCNNSSEDSDVNSCSSPKRLSKRIKKPNSKYFSEDNISSKMDSYSSECSSDFSDSSSVSKKKRKQKHLRRKT